MVQLAASVEVLAWFRCSQGRSVGFSGSGLAAGQGGGLGAFRGF